MVATPARSVAATPEPGSFPHPVITAVSPAVASRLSSSGFGAGPMSAGISTTPTSNDGVFASRHDGCAAKELAVCCGPLPRNTSTEAAGGCRQCAAVRIARGAMIVPLHDPTCCPVASLTLSRTTGEASVEQSAPLTIAMDALEAADCATALQALLT